MDYSSASWFAELGMEDPFLIDQCDIMDYLDEDQLSTILEGNSPNYPSQEPNPSNSSPLIPRNDSTSTLCTSGSPEKPHNLNSHDPFSQSPRVLTFGNPTAPELNPHYVINATLNMEDEVVSEVLNTSGSFANVEEAVKCVHPQKKTGGRKRPPSQTYDHILAERKRREQLSQRFVALSAIVPGLKKMDKTSVLGDAINYLKHLQERVKTLEQQSTKQMMESLVMVKKSQVLVEDEGSSDEMGGSDLQPLPEIEAKVCEKSILLRIHCEKHKGALVNLLSEIETLNLNVTSTNVNPFGSFALDITIIAEMEQEFDLPIKELIIRLQSALQRPIQPE